MKISKVEIKNFRNLKDIDVELENIVALIGENNSGKSNFLRALELPLSSEDSGSSKRLSMSDINNDAINQYLTFLDTNRKEIIDSTVAIESFQALVPEISIRLYLTPESNEHYDITDILCQNMQKEWVGGIQYRFYVKEPEELLDHVRNVFADVPEISDIRASLLPMEFYTYSLTVPDKNNSISFETLSRFRAVSILAERDNFASNASKLGSKALSDVLQKKLSPESKAKIERKYVDFFNTIQEEGKLNSIINWQDYSEIPNAHDFFREISILPNMPSISSILGGIRLGYDDGMHAQGLGHRNLVLMAVLLNSYMNKQHDISFRLIALEEPEAHLCNNNVLLIGSMLNIFSQKNKFTQIIYSTHDAELVNKLGIGKTIVFHNGNAYNLSKELSNTECDYLSANPNTDIFKLLYSQKVILVEGITEELLIKSYFLTRSDFNDIKVISFHKGYTKIIDIWKKVNHGTKNKLGVVRDYDNEPKAQADHEKLQDDQVIVRTTSGYTLETDITNSNYELLKEKYGEVYGWRQMTPDQIQEDWRNSKKSDVMLRICHDLINGELSDFILPPHIQEIIDFLQGVSHDS